MGFLSEDHPVLLVGAGNMGGAMLSGWMNEGRAGDQFVILDPLLSDKMTELVERHGVRHVAALPDGLQPSVVILAVKPQMMSKVLPLIEPVSVAKPVFVSIAAGTSIETLESSLGEGSALIRAMPNTPAAVGRGITIGYATVTVSDVQKQEIGALLSVTGAFDWVEEEALIDAVTAVSGSGPAYVFHMVEALAAAARETGLSPDLSLKLARATVEGAGELLFRSDLDAATLRKNVTSPGGTTAAALSVLMASDGLQPLMTKAVSAALERAQVLGRGE